MSQPLQAQIEQLEKTIAGLEAQRASLGDAVVEPALAPLHLRLYELLRQRQEPEIQTPQAPEEQRKLVSVLCADLAGFTALSTTLDPEELRDIQQAYFAAVTPPVHKRGGVVEKYIGDAVLAVFGLPQAHEDDPERAVRAALEMQSALEELNSQRVGEISFPLHMRVGVSTGTVLATLHPETGDFVVTGETVNLASRMQSLSPPGGVLIPHDTYRHLRGIFDVSPMEAVHVKGIAEPVEVYQVLQAKPRAFRTLARGVEGIETPLVGRQSELKFLQDALLAAIEEHEGRLVTIKGEAGVGKSRLLYEFQNWFELLPQRLRLFQGKARQEGQGLPYALLRDLFAYRFEILDDDRVEEVRHKLEAGFAEVFGSGDEGQMRSHFLGQLLGYDFSLSPQLKGVVGDAEQLRNRGLMYLVEYIKGLSESSPSVVLLEDLHWADDSSLDAILKIGKLASTSSLLMVGAARNSLLERRPYWGEGLEFHQFIELQPLSKRESRQLVGEILKLAAEIPTELRELVVEGGEGNPFYIEELIKMLVEGGVIIKGEERWHIESERLRQLTVPPTLAGVLQARLDALPAEERVILQQASVVGRLFWDQVVAYIHAAQAGEKEETSVPQALSALRGRELVYRREESTFVDSSEYLFKHDLLREVTYESVLKRLRKGYHALAADWLIEHCGKRIGEYRGLIAEHLLQAGRKEQALEYLQAAGKAALASFSNQEAETYFRRALDFVKLEDQRAEVLAGLAEALRRLAKHEEAAQVYRQAIELNQQLGNLDRVANLYAYLSGLLWRRDYSQAWQACQEGLELLIDAPASPGIALLLGEAGRTAHFMNEPQERVNGLLQRAIVMAENLGEVAVQADALNTLAVRTKDIPQAIQMMEKAVQLADSLGTSLTALRAHTNLGFLYDNFFIDLDAAIRESTQAAEIARQIGDIDALFFALFNIGGSMCEAGIFDSTVDFLQNFMRGFTIHPDLLEDFKRKSVSHFYYYRGNWSSAIEYIRNELERERKGGDFQTIANFSILLASSIIDSNIFFGHVDTAEAESCLMENIRIEWQANEACSLLSRIYARSQRLPEAREYLVRVLETVSEPENNREKAARLDAEAELALAEAHWDRAISALQDRIGIFQTASFRWRQARDLVRLGDALRLRGTHGDLERAAGAYRQSLEMFTEMGASGYVLACSQRLAHSS